MKIFYLFLVLILLGGGCSSVDVDDPEGFIYGDQVNPPRGATEMLERYCSAKEEEYDCR